MTEKGGGRLMDIGFTADELYYLHVRNGEYILSEDTPEKVASDIRKKFEALNEGVPNYIQC